MHPDHSTGLFVRILAILNHQDNDDATWIVDSKDDTIISDSISPSTCKRALQRFDVRMSPWIHGEVRKAAVEPALQIRIGAFVEPSSVIREPDLEHQRDLRRLRSRAEVNRPSRACCSARLSRLKTPGIRKSSAVASFGSRSCKYSK
jgi:hypothetical protein